jgi:hypothetical protein
MSALINRDNCISQPEISQCDEKIQRHLLFSRNIQDHNLPPQNLLSTPTIHGTRLMAQHHIPAGHRSPTRMPPQIAGVAA